MTANAQWALMGTLTDWSSGKAMTVSGTTATCDVDLIANTTYTLKVKNGRTWYGRNNTTITATTTTSAFSDSGGDVTLKSTFNGTYTFSFDTSSKKLTVTYPTEDKPVETHDITVKAKYPADWNAGKAAIHFWGNGVASPGTPAAMTKDGDWWTYTVTGVPTTSPLSVIFINGETWNGDKNQTVDITGITENTCFEVSQSGNAKGTAVKADCETGEGEVIETHDITVKAFYPAAWNAGKAAVHFWGDGVVSPGTPAAMTKDGDWWSYTVTGVPTTSELSVIFINGDNWNGDANQTVDITGITESTCYQVTAGAGKASAAVVDCASTPVVAEDVYTVVGSDVLLGTAWDLNNADNEMTKQDDGSYVLVKENVDLATTGTYEYKVVKNHDWGWSVPEGNANLTLKLGNEDVDGTYNVTFTLNKELNALTASLELVEAKKVIPECYVAGDESLTGQDWNAKSVSMTYDEATEVYTATLTAVPAGTHNMKVVYGGEWLGFDHLSTPAPANVKEGEDKKIQFTLSEAGNVTVTYHATNGIGLAGNFAAPVTYDYYIAGTLAGGWSATQQGMENVDGLYKTVFNALAEGTYQFKITDGQWNTEEDKTHEFTTLGAAYAEVSIVEGNVQIEFTGEAKDITVIFDATNKNITFEGLTEKVPVEKKYYLIGSFNEWTKADATNELLLDGEVYKKEVTLAADVQFKINDGADAWWGKDNLGDKTYEELEGLEDGNLKMLEEKTFTIIFNPAEHLITFEGLTEIIPTYTVAGNNAAVFGTEWDAENYENDMTLQDHDGTYVWTKPAVYLTDNVEFKVIKNLNWETAWPENNYVITITESAFYSLTIYYNPANNDITVVTNKLTAQTGSLTLDGVMLEEVDFEGMTLLSLVGNSSDWTTEVGIYLENYTGEDNAYNVYYVSTITYNANYSMDNSVSGQLTQATGVDGLRTFTGTLNVAFEGYDEETEESVVLPYQLTLTLVEKSDAATVVVVTDATVDLSDGLTMTAEWTDTDDTTYPVLVTVPGFDPSVASAELEAAVTVGGGDDDPWLGFVEGLTTVTVEDGVVEVTGVLENTWAGVKLDVTISGTLPVVTPPTPTADYTRTTTENEWGTICLPYASSSFTGATFYEVSSLVYGEGLWLDQLADGAQLEAGKPYIFQAKATEIAVTYTGGAVDAPVAGANGLTGTFTEIAAGGALVGNYIIAENQVWSAGTGASLAANRAYIDAEDVPTTAQAQMPGRRRVIMGAEDEGTSTGFENITTTDKAVKMIENGQLIIIRDGVKYNAMGVKL